MKTQKILTVVLCIALIASIFATSYLALRVPTTIYVDNGIQDTTPPVTTPIVPTTSPTPSAETDSSNTIKIGSDVCFRILGIGTFYQRGDIDTNFFWDLTTKSVLVKEVRMFNEGYANLSISYRLENVPDFINVTLKATHDMATGFGINYHVWNQGESIQINNQATRQWMLIVEITVTKIKPVPAGTYSFDLWFEVA